MALNFGIFKSLFRESQLEGEGFGKGDTIIIRKTLFVGGDKFHAAFSTDLVTYNGSRCRAQEAGTTDLYASISLPDGAKIISVTGYGNNTGQAWYFGRHEAGGSIDWIISNWMNSASTTIEAGKEIVDNTKYAYSALANDIAEDDYVHGIKIVYEIEQSVGIN